MLPFISGIAPGTFPAARRPHAAQMHVFVQAGQTQQSISSTFIVWELTA
jgi:hypothetical protein